MKELHIQKNDANQRLDKFLSKAFKTLPASLIHKAIRQKRIKRNGKRTEFAAILEENDTLQLYLTDAQLSETKKKQTTYKPQSPLEIVYEDKNILLVNKPAGLPVHEDKDSGSKTLANAILFYLEETGNYKKEDELSFTPALCNRIDRNTEGIVIAAKTAEALRFINEKIKAHEIEKSYLAIAHGSFEKKQGTVKNFLFKDAKQNKVYEKSTPVPGAKTAITHYKVLKEKGQLTLIECTLETGRTHQIRVHMAGLGHPLLGDRKYGNTEKNKPYNEKSQALCAYKVRFSFKTCPQEFAYLNNKTFKIEKPSFVQKYF